MPTYIYARVSTTGQREEGYSLSAQVQRCRRLAEDRGLVLGTETNCDEPGVFVDASSAWKVPLGTRAGGSAMLSLLKRGDTVIMYDIIRGFRSLLDFSKSVMGWVSGGIGILFVAYPHLDLTTANGRLTASVMAAYGEWKSAITSERQKEFNAARKSGLIESLPKEGKKKRLQATPESRAIVQLLRPAPVYESRTPKPEHAAVFGYVRVSTAKQSVESQVGPVQRHMDELGLIDGGMIRDKGVSALKVNFRDRPGARELLDKLTVGDHVVFLRPARAFRSVKDMVNTIDLIHSMGVTVHIAEGSMKSGDINFQLCMQIMTLMAQIESEENSRRVRDAQDWMWENGLVPTSRSNLPPWLRVVQIDEKFRHIIPDEDYLADCRIVSEIRERGLSFCKVCEEMDKIVAFRECRFPLTPGGMQVSVARQRLIRDCSSRPFHREMQRPFIQRIELAEEKNTLVKPKYTIDQIKDMRKHYGNYLRYEELLQENRMPGKALEQIVSGQEATPRTRQDLTEVSR